MQISQQLIADLEAKGLPPLSPTAADLLSHIVDARTLGASRQLKLANHLFCQMAADGSQVQTLLAQIRAVADGIIAVRGQNTPVIANAIQWVLSGLEVQTSLAEVQAFVQERRDAFNRRSQENLAHIASAGANLIPPGGTVLPFDYSSTVSAVLHTASRAGTVFQAVVPESRIIQGGRQYVEELLALGHTVHYVADMAFATFLSQVDVIFVGVECLFADGSFLNTVGTLPIAIAAERLQVPLYACTELMKIDRRSHHGYYQPIATRDFGQVLTPVVAPPGARLLTLAPELERTPASYVAGLVTELGVLPPGAVWHAARTLLAPEGAAP